MFNLGVKHAQMLCQCHLQLDFIISPACMEFWRPHRPKVTIRGMNTWDAQCGVSVIKGRDGPGVRRGSSDLV